MGLGAIVKPKFLEFIRGREEWMREVDSLEVVTRCPFCGDTQKDFRTGHFYMMIDVDTNYNIPYICFKCGEHGFIDPDVLDLLGNTDQDLANGIAALNKNGEYKKSTEGGRFVYFERKLPDEIRYHNKIAYVERRLGLHFEEKDIQRMKLVTSLYDFLVLNNIKESPFKKDMRHLLERDYVGFLSGGNSHLLFRDITGKNKYAWIKYPIETESRKNRVYYGLDEQADVYSDEEININISEGVLDAIGVKYHVMQDSKSMDIASGGSYHTTMIKHMIDVGLFGGNVILNIFSDNDRDYNDHEVKGTSFEQTRYMLQKYVPLFKQVNLYYNLTAKDFGYPAEKIRIKKERI